MKYKKEENREDASKDASSHMAVSLKGCINFYQEGKQPEIHQTLKNDSSILPLQIPHLVII
jgi:hypothetical protein